MQPRERLLDVLRGKGADRPPFICPGGMMSMAVTECMDRSGVGWPEAHTDPGLMAALTVAACELGGVENLGVPFCMTVEAEALGAAVELGTRDSEPKVIGYAIESAADTDRLRALDVAAGRAAVCVKAVRILRDRAPHLPIIANLTGPVSLAASLLDPLVYYLTLRKDPASAHRLNRACTEDLTRFAAALVEAGADVICIADPSATGEIIGPAGFEIFALPYLNAVLDHVRSSCGVPAIVHICGDIRRLEGLLSRVDAEALSVDSMVGIPLLRRMAPGKVTMGNISTFLLEKGEPGRLRSAAAQRIAAGVDILAPACGIGPRTPLANIRALAEAAQAT